MIPQPPACFVLMVHYGDPRLTRQALTALWSGAVPPTRVIIIDHAQEALTLPHDSRQHVVRPAVNAGYAAGLNIGLGMIFTARPSDRDMVVCMNNDTLVARHTIKQLLASYMRLPAPALVGARWGVINPFSGRAHLRSAGANPVPRPASLSYIDGAFFAASWTIWRRLKKIPDDYFMYWEESALQQRLRELGVPSRVMPHLGILHKDRPGAVSTAQQTYYLVRNGAHYLQTATARPLRWWWWGYNRGRYLYHSLRGPTSKLTRRALGDAIRGVRGKVDIKQLSL